MPKDEERLSGEIRDGYPDYCQTLSFTDANGVVKQLVFPKALDLDRPKRARTTFSEQQLDSLEEAFKSNQYLVGKDRMVLSNELGLSETQVKVWFQNRRTKHKKDQDKKTQTTNALAESRATKNVLQMLELKSPSSGPFPPLSPPSPILTTPPSAIELRHPDQPSQNSLSPHCKPKWNSADGAFVQSDRNNSHHHHSHNHHRRVTPQPYYYHHHHHHHHPHRAAANDHALTTQLAAVPCSIPRALDTTSTGLQHQHLHDSLVTGITSHAPLVTGITSHAPLVTGLPSHAPTVVPSPPASHAHFLFSLRGSGNPHFPSERRFLSALPPPLPHPAHSTPPSPITPTTVVRSPGSVAFDSNSRAYAPTTDYTGSAHCHYNVVRATGHTGSHRHASIPPFPLS